jgi:hypothetical protein
LEGTLHQTHDDTNAVLDGLVTQAALLKILGAVVPFVSPATLGATIGLTSRVLRGTVSTTLAIVASSGDNQGMVLDTKDGLGSTSAVLSSSCSAVSDVLRYLPHSTDDATIRQLLTGTLMGLLNDPRQKIQSASNEALCGLLLLKSPRCHPAILKLTTKYVNAKIDRYSKHPSRNEECQNMIELMGFFNTSLAVMDFTAIGGRIMNILVDLMNEESSSLAARPIFVARSRAATLQVLAINAILSTMLSLLETSDEEMGEGKIEKLNLFATRVLASLVQARPTVVFREGAAEIDLLESGRTIYGQVMLSASQRLLSCNATMEVGTKLVPLVFQQIISLCRPIQEDLESGIAETLFVEASQLIRIQLLEMKGKNQNLHDKCSVDCVRVLRTVVQSPFDKTCSPALKPFALLLQQVESEDVLSENALSIVQLYSDAAIGGDVKRIIEGALVSLVEGIGVERFWRAVDFTKLCNSQQKDATPNKYSWIFDIMKVSGSVVASQEVHLDFFQNDVLPLARRFDALSVKATKGAAVFRSQAVNLWELFPLFCYNPADLATSFAKLAPILMKAMNDQRYPEFVVSQIGRCSSSVHVIVFISSSFLHRLLFATVWIF